MKNCTAERDLIVMQVALRELSKAKHIDMEIRCDPMCIGPKDGYMCYEKGQWVEFTISGRYPTNPPGKQAVVNDEPCEWCKDATKMTADVMVSWRNKTETGHKSKSFKSVPFCPNCGRKSGGNA